MPTAWPSNARTEYDPDDAVRTTRVGALVARDEVIRQQPFAVYFADQTATTLAKVASVKIMNYDAVVGKNLAVNLSCYVTAGTGTWYYKIGSAQSGNVTVTNTSPAQRSGPPATLLVVPALLNTSGIPEQVSLEIWASCSGGIIHVAGQYDQWCWVED